MTTPAVAQQQQQPPPQNQLATDTEIISIIAVVMVSAISAEAAFQAAKTVIMMQRLNRDFEWAALRGALDAVMGHPHDRQEGIGAAQSIVARLNALRRAQFVLAAAKRITRELMQARAHGIPLSQALATAVQNERRYYGQHLQAIIQRMQAATLADSTADRYGPLLGWYAVHDKHTSAECRAADGKNFYVWSMPVIGYPGGVHPHCRCFPGRPHAGAAILPSAKMAA